MSIKQYSESQLQEMAMLEIAYEILAESNKTPADYHSLLKEVAAAKGMSEEAVKERIAHLYTEMSMDGRFVNIGDNRWGLRSWYPFDKTEEELSQANKTRKKKRSEDDDDDDFFDDEEEDFDEFEDLEDELDEIANEEDEDFETDDDEDLDEEEFDDDIEEEPEEEDIL
ncbi:DNA-directed RNA polymerase subunit delta [Evansella vedderi]|uniref:Probable DNA-directed RNA polymerase subunit delta n=1 Tax=Evansella vedderi TaxID=38282 RepID=A0ABU0A4W6_9BACI|nr:DNA-directed RNA polymerase subunit delta [Evansella vedderi]MDQ0257380.1 DNA-directed RNA polymerase subunit delta [Evansella vedderi]